MSLVRPLLPLVLLLGPLASAACKRDAAAPAAAPAERPVAAPAGSGAPALEQSTAPRARTAADLVDLHDPRKPVPLLAMMAAHQRENMRGHLVAVQEIVAGLGQDDLAAVAVAARKIGFSDEMGQMCNHMGVGAPGFTEQALAFHHTADRIVAAAEAKDRAGVMTHLSATLQTCTSCHATWRQHVVDDATWQQLTASTPPPGMHQGHAGHTP